MTNEEAINNLNKIDDVLDETYYGEKTRTIAHNSINMAIESLEENTKLKSENDELNLENVCSNHVIDKLKAEIEELSKVNGNLVRQNAKLCEEIAELKCFASTMLEKEYSGCDLLQGNNSCMDCYRFDICLGALKGE